MIMKNKLVLVLLHIFVLLLHLGFTMNQVDEMQQQPNQPEIPLKSPANSNKRPSDHAPGQPSGHAPGQPSGHAPGQPSGHAPAQPSGHAPRQPSGHAPRQPSGHAPAQPSGHAPRQPSGHAPRQPSGHAPTQPSEDKHDPPGPAAPPTVQPNSHVDLECLEEKYTRLSCAKMFCPPWQRCIEGKCLCKLPYQCPRLGAGVCGAGKKNYFSMCQAQAIACRDKKVVFSNFGTCQDTLFEVQLEKLDTGDVVVVNKPEGNEHEELLICGTKSWNMAAANVACSQQDNRGAAKALMVEQKDLGTRPQGPWPTKCMPVSCTGSERSLAECIHYTPQQIQDNTNIAMVTCYTERQGEVCNEFTCVNTKCISWNQTCDGIDDCGDNSDEMCCRGCTQGAFPCKSGVCIPPDAVQDNIRDCLGGEDETQSGPDLESAHTNADDGKPKDKDVIISNPKEEIKIARAHIESQLHCGIPNMDYINKTEEETKHKRTKRVVGGQEALPTQIQWQVAVEEDGVIHCGGVYLGGCWVLTAAHCVRPKPKAFRIKFSIWKKFSLISTSDKVHVKNIIIHSQYNSRTYENDIALIQLQELANEKECLLPNPAVRPVCVPWSPKQFLPNEICTISGWGRNKAGEGINTLKWANVTLIGNCKSYYKDRYYNGMECAGDLEGKVDSCQGDSGGPLVCTDSYGVSYVWGIVSWGEKCGEPGFPGVYTKVAHYFEWIRLHTGWPAVTRFNQ